VNDTVVGAATRPGSAQDARAPRVCVLERRNFTAWASRHAQGLEPGRYPYGLEALEGEFELRHTDTHRGGLLRSTFRPVERWLDREIAHVVFSVPNLQASDVCLSLFEDFGLTYAALRNVVRSLPPLLLVSCWTSQRVLTFAHRQVESYRRLFDRADIVVVFSANQVPILANRLGVPRPKLRVVDYGVSTDFYVPDGDPAGDGYVAAAGQDVGRDWATLFAAATALPHLPFRVATYPSDLVNQDIPPNVELVGRLPSDDYRRLLQRASVVVVASHPLPYPTGQSVTLEAMACGRPLVATASAAMAEYTAHAGAATCPAGDPEALAREVDLLVKDAERRAAMGRTAREICVQRFDCKRMWAEVGGLIRELL
jgi:glycosyltransferase involved in cell wall biosynthesis